MNFASIEKKVLNSERIRDDEALFLFTQADPLAVIGLANYANTRKNGNTVFYNEILSELE